MERRDLICIGCPMGCPLSVTMENGEVSKVTGNTCPKGAAYAKKEVTNPTRIVTSSVRVENGQLAAVSVKTASDIPKNMMFDIVRELKEVCVTAPVQIGDVILSDVCGTGVAVVATKNVLPR